MKRNQERKARSRGYRDWLRKGRRLVKGKGVKLQNGWKGLAVVLKQLYPKQFFGTDDDRRAARTAAIGCLRRIELEKALPNEVALKKLPQATSQPYININAEIKEFYASYEWRKLRYQTLTRYGLRCQCCKAVNVVLHVDHIKPLRKYWELRLDPENVQVLCEDCNHGKGNWDETDFRGQPAIEGTPQLSVNVMDKLEKPRGRAAFSNIIRSRRFFPNRSPK